MQTEVKIRPHQVDDLHFIYNSWLNSYRDSSEFAKKLSDKIYFDYHKKIIERILHSRVNTQVIVACNADDEDLIYGYAVFELAPLKIFHYVYVKRPFGGFKICSMLMDKAPFPLNEEVYASHMTHKGEKLIKKYNMVYNPYLV